VLDRASSNALGADDVAAALAGLGLDSGPAAVAAFFPRGGGASVSLAAYLGGLAADLARVGRADELAEAFGAFDALDEGVVEVGEVKGALMGLGEGALTESEIERVMEGFVGRRLAKKGAGLGGKSAEVFRYTEFVSAIWGGVGAEDGGKRH